MGFFSHGRPGVFNQFHLSVCLFISSLLELEVKIILVKIGSKSHQKLKLYIARKVFKLYKNILGL